MFDGNGERNGGRPGLRSSQTRNLIFAEFQNRKSQIPEPAGRSSIVCLLLAVSERLSIFISFARPSLSRAARRRSADDDEQQKGQWSNRADRGCQPVVAARDTTSRELVLPSWRRRRGQPDERRCLERLERRWRHLAALGGPPREVEVLRAQQRLLLLRRIASGATWLPGRRAACIMSACALTMRSCNRLPVQPQLCAALAVLFRGPRQLADHLERSAR